MKKWKDFLIESKGILKEFNKSDEKEVMKDEERFTVAYEIELVADDYEDEDDWDYEMESAMEEARTEAALEQIYDPDELYRNDLDGLEVEYAFREDHSEHPDDGDEMLEWYFENTSGLSKDDMHVIVVALGYMGDDDEDGLEGEFDSIFINIYEEPLKFLRYLLRSGSASQRELANIMGWEEKQLTFDWEAEGGRGYPPGIEVLASPKIIKKLINHFVINLDQINGPNVLPEARKNDSQINIKDFIGNFSSIRWMKFVNSASEALQVAIDDLPSEVGPILSALSCDPEMYDVYWIGKIMSKYRWAVDAAADSYIDARVSEFENNPVQELENLGYEEYQYFDVNQWAQEYRENRRGGNCSKDQLRAELWNAFPNFMKRYAANLDFKEDASLTCGIEFTMDTPRYMTGLENAFEFLRVFFEDYENHGEVYFSFTDDTGLHTNIGYIGDDGAVVQNYNLFKALLFLNDTYATKGMGFPTRQATRWTADVKQPVLDKIAAQIESLVKMPFPAHVVPSGPMPFPDRKTRTGSELEKGTRGKEGILKSLIFRNFDVISDELSNIVGSVASRMGAKSIGFNVNYTRSRNYIEFRYPGHEGLTYEIMKKTTQYYAFLVKAAADPEFKKREYLSDLIGFINKLEGEALTPVGSFDFVRKMKKGDIFLKYDFSDSWARILRWTTQEYLQSLPSEDLRKSTSASSLANELSHLIGEGIAEQTNMNVYSPRHSGTFSQYQIMMYRGVDRKNKMVKYWALEIDRHSGGHGRGFKITEQEASLKSFERDLKNLVFLTFGPDAIGRDSNPVSEEEELYREIFKVAQESSTAEEFYEGMVKLSKAPIPPLFNSESESELADEEKHIDPRTGYPYIEDLDETYLRQKFKKYNF